MKLLTFLLLSFSPFASASEQPNIIIVLADDFGWGDIALQGGKVPTPELDRMAAEGSRFTQFYVASPICSPSRAGIMTGKFPSETKITSFLQTRKGNAACGQDDFLDPKFPTLPRQLKVAGYATAHVGKWHLGGGRDVDNAPKFSAYGYDAGWGTWESPEPDPDLTATDWIWSPKDNVKRWDRTRWMVDKTLDFMKTNADKPVFVNLWFDDTHTPWVPDDAADPKAESPKQFRGVLTEMDRQIGRLLTTLRATKGRDTLVLFFGDNGALPTFAQARVGGMRGSKLSLYEGGVRVPFIAWQPGKIPAGRVDKESVISSVDLLTTLSKISGAKEETATDGEEISGILIGKSRQREKPLFWEYGRDDTAFKYPKGKNRSPNLAMREGKWKLLLQADGTGAELYDLIADPNETKNLVGEQPEVVERLSPKILAWRKGLP